MDVVGIVSQPTLTGWYVDFCNEGQLKASFHDCGQIGGEIYRATLLNVQTPKGTDVIPKLIIGFPAHALPKSYRDKKRIHLVMAPEDFRKATGIVYFARDWE
jgi:hypothetical protein